METIDVLKGARDLIAKPEDWCKFSVENVQGQNCAWGAIALVAAGDAWNTRCPETERAAEVLASVIPPRGNTGHTISCYNNSQPHECVLAAFDAAIESCEK